MKFYTALPILLKSSRLFALDGLICLFEMYLAMNFKEFLIFLTSDAMCLIDL